MKIGMGREGKQSALLRATNGAIESRKWEGWHLELRLAQDREDLHLVAVVAKLAGRAAQLHGVCLSKRGPRAPLLRF